jgi:hypothetical protein
MTYSWGDGGPLNYHGPVQYGGITMKINQNLRTVEFEHSNIDTVTTSFFFRHGLMMYIAWGVMSLVMIISARYLRILYKSRMWIHSISGSLIIITTVSTTLMIYLNERPRSNEGLAYYHKYLGVFICFWSFIQGLGGFVSRRIIKRFPVRKHTGEFVIGYK